jgi:hypothetical protein
VEKGLTERAIAERLNQQGLVTDLGRPWTRGVVRQILTNEKYIGNNVYNRVSFKLKKRRIKNTREMWIAKENAFEAIVSQDQFYMAQGIISARARRFTDEELLDRLKALYQRRGLLSGLIIDEAEDMPQSSVYSHRFGSLLRAYQLVGFQPERDYRYLETNQLIRRLHPTVLADTETAIQQLGGTVERDAGTDLLRINGEFSVSLVLARCNVTPAGRQRWKIRFDTSLAPDITVAVRLTPEQHTPLDYYLLPRIDFGLPSLQLGEHNPLQWESYRFDTLDYLYGMAERRRVRRAA